MQRVQRPLNDGVYSIKQQRLLSRDVTAFTGLFLHRLQIKEQLLK